MKNCLILLTNYYPFHKGEEYLESEIKHLADNFHQIFVISTMVSYDMRQTRKVPENVIVLPVGLKFSFIGKTKMFINQYREIRKETAKVQMIKEDSKGNSFAKLYSYYFESRAMEVYGCIEKKLKDYDFEQYSRITIYSYWFYITARVAVELKKKCFSHRNPYTVSRAHGYDINEHVNILNFLPEREFLLQSLDNLFPVSQNGVDFLKEKYSAYGDKVEVRRLGTKGMDIKGRNDSDTIHIVSCSVVRKLKRLDLLIEALDNLRREDINFKWTHIGGGPEFIKIKKLAQKKLNKDQANFTGFINNEDVLKWYKENPATVFVNVSSSEGVPVSIMEALSMGIPVIATDVGGTKEIVEDGINGYLLRADFEIGQLVERLKHIIEPNEKYNIMCNNAFEIWNQRCNSKTLYSNFANELLSKAEKVSEG